MGRCLRRERPGVGAPTVRVLWDRQPAGLTPTASAGWILGSDAFVERLAKRVRTNPKAEQRRESRRLLAVSLPRLCEVVCTYYDIKPRDLSRRGSREPARAAFAYLARQYTEATNAELSPLLGLSRPECVPSVTGRFVEPLSRDKSKREHLRCFEKVLDQLRLG